MKHNCSACGFELGPNAKFCSECGTAAKTVPVAEEPKTDNSTAVSMANVSSPASYTPKYLADKIINSRSAIEGERKQVTVLFADLKGSMELINDRDPEEAQQFLDPVVNLMMEAVHFYEGTVSLVMGDGLMAIFGAPVAHEDHAVRACYAALKIQEASRKLADELRRSHGVEINIRIGLNSGDVVVRSVGSDLRMDYSAIGHTTHLASRLEQNAESGSILIGPTTMRLVEGYVSARSGGEREIKGMDQPLEVFELLGASVVRSRLQAAVQRGLTAFLGRDAELDILNRALVLAKEGQGQAVAISGEAGIGKSRLIWEFIHSKEASNCLVLEGAPAAYGKATSYGPIIDLLRNYFEIDDLDPPNVAIEKVSTKVLGLDASLVDLLPALLSIMGMVKDDPDWNALDPQTQKRRLLDGFRYLLKLEADRKPVIFLIDDLHWLDDETQSVLDSVLEHLPTTHIMMLVGYRPEYEHSWMRKSYFREIRIAPLSTSGTKDLLDVLLGSDLSVRPLKKLLIDRTDGNPFFVEESVRTLVEMKFLGGEPGAFRLLKAADSIMIPESAKAILSARIDRLSDAEKRVLQASAVIGKEVSFSLLSRIAEVPESELRDALDHLQSLEFLYETSLFPELIFSFRHALVQEVSYRSLLGKRRIGLHRTIVEIEETSNEAPSLERIDRIAYHANCGELWEKATDYWQQAGNIAIAENALSESVNYFQNAVKSLAQTESDDRAIEREIDLLLEARAALVPLGRLTEAKDMLLESLKKSQQIEDTLREGLSHCYLCNVYWELGEQQDAIKSGLKAQELGTLLSDAKIKNSADRYLARAYQAVGDYKEAVSLFSACLPEEGQETVSHILIRVFLLNCKAELGAFEEAIQFGKRTNELVEELDSVLARSASYSALGRVYVRMSRFEEAIPLLEHALELSEKAGIALLYPFAAAPLGAAYAKIDRVDEALVLLQNSIEKAEEMNRMVDASLWRYWQALALMEADNRDGAIRAAERGLAFSITYNERGNQAGLHRILGEIYLTEDAEHLEKSKENFLKAIEIGEALDMKPVIARCHVGLSNMYRLMGDDQQSRSASEDARKSCEELGVGFWLHEAAKG